MSSYVLLAVSNATVNSADGLWCYEYRFRLFGCYWLQFQFVLRPSSSHVCVRFLSIVPVSCCLDVRTQLLAVYLRRRDGVYM